jgi:hypothetical protein
MISVRVTWPCPILVRIQAEPLISARTVSEKVMTSPQKKTPLLPGAGS